jgi:hypothetical protein
MKTHYLRWESHAGSIRTYCNRHGSPIQDQPDTYRAIVENPNTLIIITDKLEDVDCLTCIKRA